MSNDDEASLREFWNAEHARSDQEPVEADLIQTVRRHGVPPGEILEIAAGVSANALAFLTERRTVTVVDVSEVALARVSSLASTLGGTLHVVRADVRHWRADRRYALVYCVGFWDESVFASACTFVADGGLLAWEAKIATPEVPWAVPEGGYPIQRVPQMLVLDETAESGVRRIVARRRDG